MTSVRFLPTLPARFRIFAFSFLVSSKKIPRKNTGITAQEIRVIAENDEQLGVMSLAEAMKRAGEQELDLVEVSPKAQPPVCKIMDFGNYLYHQKKAEKKQKRLSKAQETKEIRFGIRISDHDFEVRTRRAEEFLSKGHPVKVILQFRGREASHPEIGLKRIDQMRESLIEIAKVEQEPKKQGRSIIVEFRTLPNQKKNS